MKQLSTLLAPVAVLFLSSCGQGDVLHVEKAEVRLSPVEGNPAVGYMELHGGRLDVDLVSVVSDDVLRMEMHETVTEDGVAKMKPLKKVAIPRGDVVKFEPGGKHLMIWGVGPYSKQRGLLTMTLIYSNDDRIEIDAAVKTAGSAE